MNMSPTINELATALAKAQAEFTSLEKNREVTVTMKTGGKYTFKYATYDEAMDMVRPILAKNGLSIVQSIAIADGMVNVATMLLHESGQWLSQELPMIPESGSPQAVGSAATYGRRYGLSAMLSLASEEDDDANIASGNHAVAKERPTTKPEPKPAAKPKAEPKPDLPPDQLAFNAWVAPLVKEGRITGDNVRAELAARNNDYAATKLFLESLMVDA